MNQQSDLDFLVGGAFGVTEKVKERANLKLRLSDMTMPHHLVRTVFLEQLYRAFTILRNEKYHNP
jgi:23S rRNA (pseudouridine1915-N3)-methyltransferase